MNYASTLSCIVLALVPIAANQDSRPEQDRAALPQIQQVLAKAWVDDDMVIRFTDTFVQRANQWQAVASHSSLEAAR
jgi:hypothetical protein